KRFGDQRVRDVPRHDFANAREELLVVQQLIRRISDDDRLEFLRKTFHQVPKQPSRAIQTRPQNKVALFHAHHYYSSANKPVVALAAESAVKTRQNPVGQRGPLSQRTVRPMVVLPKPERISQKTTEARKITSKRFS